MPPAEDSVGVNKLNGIISQVNISILILTWEGRCFVILASVTRTMSNTLFVHLSKWSRSSNLFLFKEHALWNKARDLCLLGNFKVWIWSMSQYLELTTFTGSLFFFWRSWSVIKIREPDQEVLFSESKLSLLLSFLVPYWERKRVCYGRDEVPIC